MRMWLGVDPMELCSRHLSGEHGELHKHKHSFVKHHSMTGRIVGNALEPMSLQTRHDALESEINRRQRVEGRVLTKSPFKAPDTSYLPKAERVYKIDRDKTRLLLMSRCPNCLARIETLDKTRCI